MTTPAIDHGLILIRNTLLSQLAPVRVVTHWGLGGGKLIEPRILIQPSAPGVTKRYIGSPAGWTGEIAIRVQYPGESMWQPAQTILDAATALLVPTDIIDPAYAPGWSLKLTAIRPILGLTGPQSITIGVVYRAELLPKAA